MESCLPAVGEGGVHPESVLGSTKESKKLFWFSSGGGAKDLVLPP